MIQLDQIISSIQQETKLFGNENLKPISQVGNLENATSESLIWIKANKEWPEKIIESTEARYIICHNSVNLSKDLLENKCLIQVNNPRLAINDVLRDYFKKSSTPSIHPTAIIHKDAKLGNKVSIGAYSVIGECEVGDDVRIGNHMTLMDGVKVGNNVIIGSGTVIGGEGFGYEKTENGYEKIVHIGSVVIDDDVHIGANCTIDSGVLSDTYISKGVKINNQVHIAHNVYIGKDVLVTAQVNISGSSKIGDNCWIAPGAVIRNGVKVGKNSTVGMGAIVTKNVVAGNTVIGNPAKIL